MLGVALPFGLATPTFIIEPIFYKKLLTNNNLNVIVIIVKR